MINNIKKISSIIILGGVILSCGEDELLTKEHQERLNAKTIQVSKLNDFYETFEIYVSVVLGEAYLSTIISRVDESQKISLVVRSREGQVVHNQDLRVKNGKSIIGVKADNYQSTTQIDKNAYGKITLYTLNKRTLRDVISNSKEDFIYIDFLGFNYKIQKDTLKNYIKTLDDITNNIWDLPVDLTIEDDKPIVMHKEAEEIEEETKEEESNE